MFDWLRSSKVEKKDSLVDENKNEEKVIPPKWGVDVLRGVIEPCENPGDVVCVITIRERATQVEFIPHTKSENGVGVYYSDVIAGYCARDHYLRLQACLYTIDKASFEKWADKLNEYTSTNGFVHYPAISALETILDGGKESDMREYV